MVLFYYISLVTRYMLLLLIDCTFIYSLHHSIEGVNHLIDFESNHLLLSACQSLIVHLRVLTYARAPEGSYLDETTLFFLKRVPVFLPPSRRSCVHVS